MIHPLRVILLHPAPCYHLFITSHRPTGPIGDLQTTAASVTKDVGAPSPGCVWTWRSHVTDDLNVARTAVSPRRMLVPLALAQFICSFAGSNMNVMINDISKDLDTTVQGVQTAITLFLLIMAALMIPGSKLTDRWGRKRCFIVGLTVYGVGALLSAISPGLGVLILGNSVLEGVGSALLIPPVYILTTLIFTDLVSRPRAFGRISGLGGIGAATGPLIGGLMTTAISWRAAFLFQTAVIVAIVLLSRRLADPLPPDPTRPFDTTGAVLSAVGMLLVVVGILQAGSNGVLMMVLLAVGAAFLFWFFVHIRARERAGKEPLLSIGLFRNRTSNLGLVTQNIQWLLLVGISFVVSVFLQVVRGYNAIETGVIFTATTVGILVSSLAAERIAGRRAEDPDPGGLHHHHRRDRAADRLGHRLRHHPGLPTWAAADRPGPGRDADPVGQRGAVRLPRGAAGGDLGVVAQRLQPGLVAGHRDRRHHPGVRPGVGESILRTGDGRPGRDRAHRLGGRATAPFQSRATAGLTRMRRPCAVSIPAAQSRSTSR
jgi:MFS family permease